MERKRRCGDGCGGCVYRVRIGGNGPSVCDYISQTGNARNCPPGEDCDKYKPRNWSAKKFVLARL